VDDGPLDECKEGGDGALLRLGEHGDGDSADFSLQPPPGQMQGWRHATACYSASGRSLYAPVPCACCCAEQFSASECARPSRDADGQQLCELCPVRLTKGGPHRPHGAGRAHVTCILRTQRAAACADASATAALPPPCLALSGRSTRCGRHRSESERRNFALSLPRQRRRSDARWKPSHVQLLPLLLISFTCRPPSANRFEAFVAFTSHASGR
jgi:hypothetical protein